MKLIVIVVVILAVGCAWAFWRSRQTGDGTTADRATSVDTIRRRSLAPDVVNTESARIAKYVTSAVAQAGRELAPGMTTQDVARRVLARLPSDIEPAMLGFNGFPAAVSISVNEEVLHGIPSEARHIAEGDLVKIQFSGKTSLAFAAIGWTFAVGRPSDVAKQMLDAGILALQAAVARIGPDVRSGDIGAEIQPVIERAGFAVVRDYVGYTMGAEMIHGPQLPCYGVAGQGPTIEGRDRCERPRDRQARRLPYRAQGPPVDRRWCRRRTVGALHRDGFDHTSRARGADANAHGGLLRANIGRRGEQRIMTASPAVTFTKLNDGWNAEPNAPEPTVAVRDGTVVFEFYANAFVYSGFEEGDRLRLVFAGATRYRLGPTNDEGWWRGQCRFGRAAPAWGEFYELTGDLTSARDPDDWVSLAVPKGAARHFLFHLRDETFECSASTWHVERVVPPDRS